MPELVDNLFRRHAAELVASLTRVFGPAHLDTVEDVVQEALSRALRRWPYEGVPDDPRAWLARVARNRALDLLRAAASARREGYPPQEQVESWASGASAWPTPPEELADDALRMMFTCCQPLLARETRVALTLKACCGFGTREIARAFLVSQQTIAQRLVRAKRLLREADPSFEVPAGAELGRRREAVLDVLYLLFNEGHTAGSGDELVRHELLEEALRLGRLVATHPRTASPSADALLALMELHAARAPARTDAGGELVPLAAQDRRLWDRARLRAGLAAFERSLAGSEQTLYHVEAAIAVCHASAADYASTDWATIVAHYDERLELSDSAVVRLNRAVAVAKARGVEAGLDALDALVDGGTLADYALLPATRGLLLWELGRSAQATAAFGEALALRVSEPERRWLERRRARCAAGAACDPW